MIYAVTLKKTDSAITDSNPSILAFTTQEAFDAMQDRFWQGSRYEGSNLVPISFGAVQSYKGLKVMYGATEIPDVYCVELFRDSDDEWWGYTREYYEAEGGTMPTYISASEIKARAAAV
jgi:hypothetical protein